MIANNVKVSFDTEDGRCCHMKLKYETLGLNNSVSSELNLLLTYDELEEIETTLTNIAHAICMFRCKGKME